MTKTTKTRPNPDRIEAAMRRAVKAAALACDAERRESAEECRLAARTAGSICHTVGLQMDDLAWRCRELTETRHATSWAHAVDAWWDLEEGVS